jgi:aldehyde:ferredoxin oxidoreductase
MPYTFGGYMGQILRVDLGRKKHHVEPLPHALVRNYLGGLGFAARMLFDEVGPKTDPLGPGNELIFATGPLTGTLWPTSGRFMVASKSPLTGVWGEAHAGGYFGPELKYAGYDALVIQGRSEKPVYLWIDDDSVEIRSAKELWGHSTAETTDMIREAHDDQGIEVLSIGRAGENLVRFACIMNDFMDAFGRTGLGAVMGSKHLKAIAARGTGGVRVSNEEEFLRLAAEGHERVFKEARLGGLKNYGTSPPLIDMKRGVGDLPTRNHQTLSFEEAKKFGCHAVENYFMKNRACFGCPIRCKKIHRVPSGRGELVAKAPEYESTCAFGPNCGVDDYGAILEANRLCDLHGMDTMSAGVVISWLMECYEKGIVTKEDCDGLDLRWGNSGAMVTLVKKIANREGIGNLLAEGVYRAAEKLGRGSMKYCMHVKRMEMDLNDGRGHRSLGLTQATSPRGSCHMRSLVVIDQGYAFQKIAAQRYGEDKLPEICDPYGEKYKALVVKDCEDVYAIRDSLLMCWYACGWPPVFWIEDFAAAAAATTGIREFGDVREMYRIAERICNLRRAFNVREGLGPKDDTLPDRILKEPIPDGPSKGQVVNLEVMLRDYYELRKWPDGNLTRKTLTEVGLVDVADELERLGRI